ncbi:MAG: FG-GAP repeat protein, partial [Akkermansiaceae bacterium]|nr:FG-GAP repeat protein [Akkermansiaceae bacterium]
MKKYLVTATILFSNEVLTAAVLREEGDPTKTRFGTSSSAAGSRVVVGAPEATGPTSRGAAYFFADALSTTGNLTPGKILTKTDGLASDRFGDSVSIAADTALVGAPEHDTSGPATSNQGAAYLYREVSFPVSQVTQTSKLLPASGAAGNEFGRAVALDPSAQAAVVSAPRLNLIATGINRGVLYTFVNLQSISAPTVNERAILYANDGNAGDLLGISAAAWNLNALAGAPGDDTDAVTDHGSAYLWRSFDQPTGLVNFHVKLTAGDRAAGDEFGRAVALSGNTTLNSTYALVGAPGDDFGAVSNQGSAYLFNLGASATGTVTQTAKLVASTGNAEHVFGSSVAISGQVGLVGSPANGAPGHAYLFLNLASASGTVNETLRLSSPNQLADNAFGASVAIDGDMIVVGEPARFLSLDERGRSFTTRVSDLTTVDTAAAVREIDQLLVRSRGSWIIGQTQDNITMTLGGAAEMQLVTSGTGIRVGNTHAADNNLLVVLGTVAGAPAVTVGTGSNTGNQLRVNGAVTANAVTVNEGSILSGIGTISAPVTVTGSVRPGTTGIGALTVQGDVTWNAGTAW